MDERRLSREELAAIEVGKTEISRALSLIISGMFLFIIFLTPAVQLILDSNDATTTNLGQKISGLFSVDEPLETNGIVERVTKKNDLLMAGMTDLEDNVEDESFLRDGFLVPGQSFLLGVLNKGNEKVYPGKDGWLFYAPDMEYLFGPGFLNEKQLKKRASTNTEAGVAIQSDPVKGIVQFKTALDDLGIQLLVVPTPIKGSLHPEKFSSIEDLSYPLQNKSWDYFLEQLKEIGIDVFDPALVLQQYRKETHKDVYLKTDTHWTPEGMDKVASALSLFIQDKYGIDNGSSELERVSQKVSNKGDIEVMLQLSGNSDLFENEEVNVFEVTSSAHELWQASRDADVLLLGDSFSNIFSLEGMGWGQSAGLAEQLSYYLQKDVDAILQNDAGSYATREKLSVDLARGQDRLAGKKLVIWQFATRELSFGDWKYLPLKYREKEVGDFFVHVGPQKRQVEAEILSISRSPRPGSVPYKDNIITMHLTNIKDGGTGEYLGEALVYTWGMQNNVLSPTATMRSGELISLHLSDWDVVENQYSSYRRTTLDDELIEYEIPNWGDLIK